MNTLPKLSIYQIVVGLLLAVLFFLIFRILGDTGLGRISVLNEQIEAKRLQADTMLQRNQLMAQQIELIKNDSSQVEVLARYHFGMVKPGEIFIQTSP